MRLIGLDPGLASFGIAVATLLPPGPGMLGYSDARFDLVKVIRTQKADKKRNLRAADDTADRLQTIANELVGLVDNDVVALCVEAVAFPYGKTQTSVISALGRVRGLVDMLAAIYHLPVVEESSQVLKLLTAGKRSASKREVQSALELEFPELRSMWPKQKTMHEHAADACAAVVAGLKSNVVIAARRAGAA